LLSAAPADRMKLMSIGGSRFQSLVVPIEAHKSKPLYEQVEG
jgi:hypothetical protein